MITRRDKDRHALCDCLLVGRIEGSVRGGAILRLTLTITDAHDGGGRAALIQQILNGDEATEGSRVLAGSKQKSGTRRYRAGVLDIDDRFAIVAISARVRAIVVTTGRRGMDLSKRGVTI